MVVWRLNDLTLILDRLAAIDRQLDEVEAELEPGTLMSDLRHARRILLKLADLVERASQARAS